MSLLIEKDRKFCPQGMIILGSVGELIIKISHAKAFTFVRALDF